MAVPLPQQPDRPYTSGSLGYFHLRLVGPAPALLLLRTDRLYSLSHSRRRGYRLRLLASSHRRRARDLLLSTYGSDLRLTHRSGTGSPSINGWPLCVGTPTELAVEFRLSCSRRHPLFITPDFGARLLRARLLRFRSSLLRRHLSDLARVWRRKQE